MAVYGESPQMRSRRINSKPGFAGTGPFGGTSLPGGSAFAGSGYNTPSSTYSSPVTKPSPFTGTGPLGSQPDDWRTPPLPDSLSPPSWMDVGSGTPKGFTPRKPAPQPAPASQGMWGWRPPQMRLPTIHDRGIAEGYANRNMLLGGHAGFAGQMQNAMSQIGAMNLANQQASLEQRKMDMLNRMFSGGGQQQFSNIPAMQLPSGRGSVYMSPYYEGATPAAPEGMSAADATRYANATRGAEAQARTRLDLAGTSADAEQTIANQMADSDVLRQLNALNTQRMASQMGYQRGLRGLMAAGV